MSTTVDISKAQPVSDNLKALVDGNTLILVIDMNGDVGPSASGKMRGVVSTGGFTAFPNGLKGNVYIGRKAK